MQPNETKLSGPTRATKRLLLHRPRPHADASRAGWVCCSAWLGGWEVFMASDPWVE